ncbi:hypothetical protein RJ640_021421 [Escallonia rubra]|uniref:Cytochrome c oxidase assembly factor 5 n=1 Tax=Escallonia rubra TaxID=112253 RepID=A0AA88U9U0_9ASTE|nr:hypothetical protein RJ640_021421 [Escallonia rubra]
MAKSCKGLAMELVKCLNESDCVQVDKRSYRECAKEKSPSISSECVGLRETYFNCKRGQERLVQKWLLEQGSSNFNKYVSTWLLTVEDTGENGLDSFV